MRTMIRLILISVVVASMGYLILDYMSVQTNVASVVFASDAQFDSRLHCDNVDWYMAPASGGRQPVPSYTTKLGDTGVNAWRGMNDGERAEFLAQCGKVRPS